MRRIRAAAAAKLLQSCPTLCDPIDSSPPGSPVPGILQARTLEWVAISFSNGMKVKSEREVVQSCPTLSNPMDCSRPGSSVHGIFQARILEWGTIAFCWRIREVKWKDKSHTANMWPRTETSWFFFLFLVYLKTFTGHLQYVSHQGHRGSSCLTGLCDYWNLSNGEH